MEYLIRKTTYEPIDLDSLDVMTLAEAAGYLGITISGVESLIRWGTLDELQDPAHQQQRHTLVLRNQIHDLAESRLAEPKSELTPAKAAAMLGVTKGRISQLLRAGRLELTRASVEAYDLSRNE